MRIDGAEMSYVDEGRGPAVLFSHGTPTSSHEWRHVIRALSPSFRCVAPDHLGFGGSDRPEDADYRPEAHSARFQAFADALGLDDLTLVVHDFGGPIALPLALSAAKRVRALAVLNSWMWSFTGDRELVRVARFLAGPVGRLLYRRANLSLRVLMPYAYGDRAKLTPEIHAHYRARFPDPASRELVLWALARSLTGSASFFDGLWDRRDALSRIPSTVVWGMKDRALAPRLLPRWREALPHARVVEVPDAGHWPQEEQPEVVVSALTDLLTSR